MSSLSSSVQFENQVPQNEVSSRNHEAPLVKIGKECKNGRDTQSGQREDLSFFSFLRPDLESLSRQEISFQKNYLAQHIKATDLILQKSKESMPHTQNRSSSNSCFPSLQAIPQQNCKMALENMIKGLEVQCQMMGYDQIMKDLRRQRDLSQFLEYLIRSYRIQFVSPLIAVAIDIWGQVRSLNLKELEVVDFRRLAASFTNRKIQSYSEGREFQQLKELSEKLEFLDKQVGKMSKFKELIKRFATTILLIVGGYFENPFAKWSNAADSEEEEVVYPKRQSSSVSISFMSYGDICSDQQFSLQPLKKIKSK